MVHGEDWPDKARLSLTLSDFEDIDAAEFLAWLFDLQARGAIKLDTSLRPANRPRPWTDGARPVDNRERAEIVEVPSPRVSSDRHFLLSFWTELDEYPPNIVKVGGRSFCREPPASLSPLARTAKCASLATYPGLAVFGIYIPAAEASHAQELEALREIAALPELEELRRKGAPYGFSSPIFVRVTRDTTTPMIKGDRQTIAPAEAERIGSLKSFSPSSASSAAVGTLGKGSPLR